MVKHQVNSGLILKVVLHRGVQTVINIYSLHFQRHFLVSEALLTRLHRSHRQFSA